MNVSIVASDALLALGLSLLVAIIWDRRGQRAFIREGPVFAARFRCAGPSPRCWRWLRRGWSRKMWAYWRDDVLVIRRGWVFDRRLRMFAQITLAGVYGLSGQRGAIAVHGLRVSLGELSGVEPELLTTAFDTFKPGTVCANATLELLSVKASWRCRSCATEVASGQVLRCPKCDAPARLAQGDEILLERIESLGQMGDVVKVKPGYARNFLLPQKKAMRATKENLAYFEGQRAQLEAHNLSRRQEAEAIAQKLDGLDIVVIRQAGETGQLYGSVGTRDIAAAVTEAGFTIARRQVLLDQQRRELAVRADGECPMQVAAQGFGRVGAGDDEIQVTGRVAGAELVGHQECGPFERAPSRSGRSAPRPRTQRRARLTPPRARGP